MSKTIDLRDKEKIERIKCFFEVCKSHKGDELVGERVAAVVEKWDIDLIAIALPPGPECEYQFTERAFCERETKENIAGTTVVAKYMYWNENSRVAYIFIDGDCRFESFFNSYCAGEGLTTKRESEVLIKRIANYDHTFNVGRVTAGIQFDFDRDGNMTYVNIKDQTGYYINTEAGHCAESIIQEANQLYETMQRSQN